MGEIEIVILRVFYLLVFVLAKRVACWKSRGRSLGESLETGCVNEQAECRVGTSRNVISCEAPCCRFVMLVLSCTSMCLLPGRYGNSWHYVC